MPSAKSTAPDRPAVAGRLRELIQASGKSLRAVAAECEIDHANLSRIAAGQIDPRASTVGRILDAVGGSWADLD